MLNKDELGTSENKGLDFRIVEFQPRYQNQIISVVGKGLMELKVIPESNEPLQDEDLYQIPEIYKDRGRFWLALENDKAKGYKELILNTHLLMKRAHRFYEKNGFERIGQDSEKYHYRLEL